MELNIKLMCPVCKEWFKDFNSLKAHCLLDHDFYDRNEMIQFLMNKLNNVDN